jgi:hypothetical protein
MGISEEIERLAKLKESGAISEAEYSRMKEAAIGGGAPPAPPPAKKISILRIFLLLVLAFVSLPLCLSVLQGGRSSGAGASSGSLLGPIVIREEVLNVPDGGGMTYTLPAGTYRVEVHAPAGGGHGVKLRWVGPPCPAMAEAVDHDVTCTAPLDGTELHIENPSLLGFGGAAVGSIKITRQ